MIIVTSILATSCGVQQQIRKADRMYAIGEYYEAGMMYKRIYPKINSKTDKPLRGEVAFKQGECWRHINNPRAVQAYNNAIRNLHYEVDSMVYLRHAQALHYQGRYAEASRSYQLFIDYAPKSEHIQEAKDGLYACQHITQWQEDVSRYQVTIMKPFVGRRAGSFSPCYAGEESSTLVFTSNRTTAKKKERKNSPVTGVPINQLYSTRMDTEGKWSVPEMLDGLYVAATAEGDGSESGNTEGDEGGPAQKEKKAGTAEMGVCCFSPDGRTMFFTYSKPINGKDIGSRIYTSSKGSGTWGEPQELKLFADSSISVGHPALSHSEDTLFFSSDAPGGWGGKDIWFSVKDGQNWTVPQNAGPQINTTGDELFPTIRPDGTLYFASNGRSGFGGLDIYRAVPDTISRHVHIADSLGYLPFLVYNMGWPFNSSADDFGITFAPQGEDAGEVAEQGFFSSNRGDRKGVDQIYSFLLPQLVYLVEGTVCDQHHKPVSDAFIRVIGDDGTNTRLQVRRDGTYRMRLLPNVHYAILATARGHLNANEKIATIGHKQSHTFTQDFTLTALGRPVKMENIFYDFGRWTLRKESTASLDALVKLLNDNPNVTIELSAHTDMVGNADANRILSEKRAQACINYLIAHGIAAERLTPKGYGKEKPVVADLLLHQQFDFIPVEQVLDETFILSLPPKQQKICNQINRRTEFRVLKVTYGLY